MENGRSGPGDAGGRGGRVAVIANQGKEIGGAGLDDLRRALADAGVADPLWYEVPKSRHAPEKAAEARRSGAGLVLVWGGDGTVQRTVDALAGSGIPIGILPAGTANLLASALGVPTDLHDALDVALHGPGRVLDVGVINGERFLVMAGTGFDAAMIAGVDGDTKDRFGRWAYVWSGLRAVRRPGISTRIDVDGKPWFSGTAGCVLFGNIGTVAGNLVVFEHARPDDGRLDVGVSRAAGPGDWLRVFTRLLTRRAERSPLLEITSGRRIDVEHDDDVAYELDGGDREPARKLEVLIEPAAVEVRVPADGTG